MSNTYNLFISHSWAYSPAYDNLIAMLDTNNYFHYRNHSVPKDDPIHNAPNQTALRQAIKNRMNGCHAVLVMAGVYSTHSKWINEEIVLANSGFFSPKPIIAIEPWGSTNTSTVVRNSADIVVAWNTSSIISAIREVGLSPS